MADKVGAEVVEANKATTGVDKSSPQPSSMQRHVYHTTGAADFLDREKALQG